MVIYVDLLEDYKELYYKEIEYTERLNSKINTCITFLTIIGSGVILVWSQFGEVYSSEYFWTYLILCGVSSVSFIFCIIFFYKAYTGYEIHYFPIKDMAIACNETYKLVYKGLIEREQAEKHVKNMMSERYLNDAIHNREQNSLKNKRHRRLIHFVAITFIILLTSYAFSLYLANYSATDININNYQQYEGDEKMANNADEVKLTQTAINGIPLPQTPKAEVITESLNLFGGSNDNVITQKDED